MKKNLIATFCILLVCAFPLAVSASGAEVSADTEPTSLLSKKFEEWVLPHLEEISVIVTLAFSSVYQIRKNKLLTKSMGAMNHNTVAVAEQSADMMTQAREGLENAAASVKSYEARIGELLEAYRSTAEDKKSLEREMQELRAYCQTATEANVEFANELAELLSLANIPEYKKEEIGARHLAAVRAIEAAQKRKPVKEQGDDGETA